MQRLYRGAISKGAVTKHVRRLGSPFAWQPRILPRNEVE